MKITTFSILLLSVMAASLSGCARSATEEEKAAFNRRVYNQVNIQEQAEFDDAIEPGYQNVGVGQMPDWDMPAN